MRDNAPAGGGMTQLSRSTHGAWEITRLPTICCAATRARSLLRSMTAYAAMSPCARWYFWQPVAEAVCDVSDPGCV